MNTDAYAIPKMRKIKHLMKIARMKRNLHERNSISKVEDELSVVCSGVLKILKVNHVILRLRLNRSVRDLSGRVDRLEGMMRWMTERMAASAGMDIPVFPGPGHHQDPQDPGGHA
ncbi:hypothetical protein E3N88_09703 [Mikania micrantha]|uniref:Uncharacterized protein n=1 Tax=Mikania micrantha TaxID=192012 RepID=A0A5N6PKP5_9ASTR|nr:hypothetical protein E3N88_09703 [Mikania micrantha]